MSIFGWFGGHISEPFGSAEGISRHIGKAVDRAGSRAQRTVQERHTLPTGAGIVDAEGAICHAVGNSELTAKRLVEYALEHHKIGVEGQTMVIIDECQIIFNCRDFGRKDRGAWVTLFSQHRKLGFNFILITQNDRMLDKQIRALVETEVRHRKLNNYGFGGLLISLTGMTWFVAIEYWYGGNKLMLSKQIFAYHKKYSKVYDSYKLFSDMVSAGGAVCAGGNRASGGAPGNGGPDAHDQQAKKRLMRRLVAVLTVIQNSDPGPAAAAEL